MRHQCCSKQKMKRGLWSPEEDEKLVNYITIHGHSSWSSVPKRAGLQRCGKSCRLRWLNYLRPDVKRGSFSAEEERTIIEVHRMLGNRWAQISKHLPGRTDNEVKNFWNSCIKKKLIAQGIDPNTHNLLSSTNKTTKIKHKPINQCSNINVSHKELKPSLNSQPKPFLPTLHDDLINPNPNPYSTIEGSTIATCAYPNAFTEMSRIASGCGVLEENGITWGNDNVEPVEPTIQRQEDYKLQLRDDQQKGNCQVVVETEKNSELSVEHSMDIFALFENSNFDFDFTESTLMGQNVIDPTNQFSWDY